MCFVCGLSLFFNELLYIHNSERHASLRGGNCCTDIQPHGVAVDNIACLLKGSAKTTTPMCVGAVYSKPCERRRCRLRGFLVVCVVVFCLCCLLRPVMTGRWMPALRRIWETPHFYSQTWPCLSALDVRSELGTVCVRCARLRALKGTTGAIKQTGELCVKRKRRTKNNNNKKIRKTSERSDMDHLSKQNVLVVEFNSFSM